jgi:hypothetical protein
MPSPGITQISIANFSASDQAGPRRFSHQHQYLSPPLTPFGHFTIVPNKPESSSSSPSSGPLSLPGVREMLPQQNRRPTPPADPAYPPPAHEPHAERTPSEAIARHSSTSPGAIQFVNDPARILPLHPNPSLKAPSASGTIASPLRRNKAHVASACVNCKKAHLACDGNVPFPSIYRRLIPSIPPLPSPFRLMALIRGPPKPEFLD